MCRILCIQANVSQTPRKPVRYSANHNRERCIGAATMTPQPTDMHRQPCPPHSASGDDLPQHAVALAERLLRTSRQEQTAAEQEQAARLARMMADPTGKELTIALVDQAFRSHHP